MKRFGSSQLLLTLLILTPLRAAPPQSETANLAQQLGYGAEAKLVIVHADDIGVSHSVNRATIAAFEKGLVNSGSIMVPCPWFPEIAAHARERDDLDLGLHLTLTSEWKHYRWDGVLGAGATPSLHDDQGFLHADTPQVARNADPREAEREIRAQVERALAFGVRPTHLDSHMGSLFATPELFQVYLRVAADYGLPALVPRDALSARAPEILRQLPAGTILVDRLAMATPRVPAEQWEDFYIGVIEQLQPGVTEIIVHLGYDDAELRSVTEEHPDYGAAWRQRDFDFFTSDRLAQLLEDRGIRMVTWREIGKLLRPEQD